MTYDNLMQIMDENSNKRIQSIFSSEDPQFIANTIANELNTAIKKLVIIRKEQVKKFHTPYWNQKLECQQKKFPTTQT